MEQGIRGKIVVVKTPEEAEFAEFVIDSKVVKQGEKTDRDAFDFDLRNSKLEHYRGTHVLYFKGVFCGQSKSCRDLYENAFAEYGGVCFSIYEVPNAENKLKLEDRIQF